MPFLQNPRHEAFARARANGALLEDAYEAAGFAPGRNHASRLARMPEVAERIGEMRSHAQLADTASPAAMIGALLQLAQTSQAQGGAGIKEARLAFMDAFRVRGEWMRERQNDFKAAMEGDDSANDRDL